jgi:hypothetical protein
MEEQIKEEFVDARRLMQELPNELKDAFLASYLGEGEYSFGNEKEFRDQVTWLIELKYKTLIKEKDDLILSLEQKNGDPDTVNKVIVEREKLRNEEKSLLRDLDKLF